jgi:hypothetical protein
VANRAGGSTVEPGADSEVFMAALMLYLIGARSAGKTAVCLMR